MNGFLDLKNFKDVLFGVFFAKHCCSLGLS